MAATTTHVFGIETALPEGWVDESIFVFAGPRVGKGGVAPSVTVSRLQAKDLESAIAQLDKPSWSDATVLAEDLKEGTAGTYFERVVRFSDTETAAVLQQSVRVVAGEGTAFVFTLTTPAIEFNRTYSTFVAVVDRVVAGTKGTRTT